MNKKIIEKIKSEETFLTNARKLMNFNTIAANIRTSYKTYTYT